MTALLETRRLNRRFGGLLATADVDFTLERGDLHCLIGPNGAGKSTFFRLLTGTYPPTSGAILYQGEDITRLRAEQRVRRGISVKFQVPGIFSALSVAQNMEIALQHHLEGHGLTGEVARQLAFLNLTHEAAQQAGNLSHGQKQWLEIGMALALKPTLLLLDEPTAGMSLEETRATGEMVLALNRDGMTVLAVEHDMAFVRQVARAVTVLHVGRVFARGSVDQIMADDRVAAIYLGQGHHLA